MALLTEGKKCFVYIFQTYDHISACICVYMGHGNLKLYYPMVLLDKLYPLMDMYIKYL